MKKILMMSALAMLLAQGSMAIAGAADARNGLNHSAKAGIAADSGAESGKKAPGKAGSGEFHLPQFETIHLPNGLTLLLMERHGTPLIAISAVVNTGSINDGRQGGLANLTSRILRLGSANFPKETVDQTFDFKGAILGSASNAEQSALMTDFAAADADTLLPMFADLLQHPAFDAAEFDKLRALRLADLQRAKESPDKVLDRYYQSLLFGNKPYGNPVAGSEKSLAALTVTDVRQFHQTWYRPDNTAIVVVGDFKPAAMREQLGKLFGGWQAPSSALTKAADLGTVNSEQARVWLVNKSDALETTFEFGGKGIARNDPDYVPLQVINTVLGGRFTSWLNDELRVNSGLTYGAGSEFLTLSQTGSFAISSATANEKTAAALELAMRTYQRLWDQGIDAATLASAKAYVKGQFPPRFETNQQLASLLSDMFTAKLGREQIDHFSQDVDSLTPARCKQLIQQHFPRNNLQMLLIGKGEAIRTIAAKYGKVREIEIKADGFGAQE